MKFVTEEQDKLTQNHLKADEEIKKMAELFSKYDAEAKQDKEQKELLKIYSEKKK